MLVGNPQQEQLLTGKVETQNGNFPQGSGAFNQMLVARAKGRENYVMECFGKVKTSLFPRVWKRKLQFFTSK